MRTPRQTDVSSSSSAPGQPEGCWNHSLGAHLMKKSQIGVKTRGYNSELCGVWSLWKGYLAINTSAGEQCLSKKPYLGFIG